MALAGTQASLARPEALSTPYGGRLQRTPRCTALEGPSWLSGQLSTPYGDRLQRTRRCTALEGTGWLSIQPSTP
eukprot:scaffold54919_cov48-Phaeocystis_antarctica.AAC.2